MVFPSELEYSYKYEDRKAINKLFKEKGPADDILIVKKGLITDTSFCNILFYNGKNWITPSFPLLKGTQRRYLLEQERIIPAEISTSDLQNFSKARLINAMIRFEDSLDIDIQDIF
jgi:4-amino-4-deoxychorismate lyase